MTCLTRLRHTKSSPTVVAPSTRVESAAEPSQLSRRRLQCSESSLWSVKAIIETLTPGPDLDACLVQHLQEQIGCLRAELSDVVRDLLSMEHEDRDRIDHESNLDKALSDLSLQIRRLLSDRATSSTTKETKSGTKLPRINVPTFDGNILNWNNIWQHFDVAIHRKAQLKDAEKLVYLRDALKDGLARHVVEGLSQDENYYKETISCLQNHYVQPRLIYQEHVRAFYEALYLRDSNGHELRCLHDVAATHLRTLKVINYEPSGPYVTSILELKLNSTTMFEW